MHHDVGIDGPARLCERCFDRATSLFAQLKCLAIGLEFISRPPSLAISAVVVVNLRAEIAQAPRVSVLHVWLSNSPCDNRRRVAAERRASWMKIGE